MSEALNNHSRLPSGWEWVAIGETGEYINGFAFKPSHRESNGLPIVRIQNLRKVCTTPAVARVDAYLFT